MSYVLVGNIPVDCHPKVQALAEYWMSIHPAKGLPGRRHFEPCDIPTLLPSLYLVDVCPQSGEAHVPAHGNGAGRPCSSSDYTGQPFESAYDSGKQSNSYRDIRGDDRRQAAALAQGARLFHEGRDHLTLERVVLPLARDGTTIDIVLGMILAHTADGRLV